MMVTEVVSILASLGGASVVGFLAKRLVDEFDSFKKSTKDNLETLKVLTDNQKANYTSLDRAMSNIEKQLEIQLAKNQVMLEVLKDKSLDIKNDFEKIKARSEQFDQFTHKMIDYMKAINLRLVEAQDSIKTVKVELGEHAVLIKGEKKK